MAARSARRSRSVFGSGVMRARRGQSVRYRSRLRSPRLVRVLSSPSSGVPASALLPNATSLHEWKLKKNGLSSVAGSMRYGYDSMKLLGLAVRHRAEQAAVL